MFHIWL